ncbi:carcinoembryonic antigen-related cell adhesion molecule 5-like [Gracilinanus agilis]|uniref:carcinoembryonic antigen-related cell adhesion molecule 5-like n=1 Tax=Gracilinanus agilis TaxID=191870 RepID=UPI001CFE39E6|nr:carcinoembryonic antigen-related cell adhesion molecule 5-like [Gracilinanus agilis]
MNNPEKKNIEIQGPLSRPTIISSIMAPVENRDTVTLTCQATGVIVMYRWFINQRHPAGGRINVSPDNRTLTIHTVTREDKGPYVCEVRNPFTSNRNDPYTLNVTYGPETPTIVTTADHYNVGERIKLICSAVSNPPAQFTWILNGKKLSNSATFSATANTNHTGTYTCHTSNSITGLNNTKEKSLIIYGPLARPIIISSIMAPVENRDTVTLTCQATGVIVTYRWFINQRDPAGGKINVSPDNRTLTIHTVTREDKGPYVCEVRNPFTSNRNDPYTLNVTYGPETPMITPIVGHYNVGDHIKLICSAVSNPPAQFTWILNGKMLSNSATFSATANMNHAGTYTCHTSNSITGLNNTKEKSLIIYGPLSKPIIISSNMVPVENKDSFSLTCQATGVIVTYRWFIDQRAPSGDMINVSPDNRTLTIRSMPREDKRPFVCETENPFKRDRSDPFIVNVTCE